MSAGSGAGGCSGLGLTLPMPNIVAPAPDAQTVLALGSTAGAPLSAPLQSLSSMQNNITQNMPPTNLLSLSTPSIAVLPDSNHAQVQLQVLLLQQQEQEHAQKLRFLEEVQKQALQQKVLAQQQALLQQQVLTRQETLVQELQAREQQQLMLSMGGLESSQAQLAQISMSLPPHVLHMARAGQIEEIEQFWGKDIAQAACRYITTASMAWEFEWHAAAIMQQIKSMHVPPEPVDAVSPNMGESYDVLAKAMPRGLEPVALPRVRKMSQKRVDAAKRSKAHRERLCARALEKIISVLEHMEESKDAGTDSPATQVDLMTLYSRRNLPRHVGKRRSTSQTSVSRGTKRARTALGGSSAVFRCRYSSKATGASTAMCTRHIRNNLQMFCCTSCNGWFHVECEGIGPNDVCICRACRHDFQERCDARRAREEQIFADTAKDCYIKLRTNQIADSSASRVTGENVRDSCPGNGGLHALNAARSLSPRKLANATKKAAEKWDSLRLEERLQCCKTAEIDWERRQMLEYLKSRLRNSAPAVTAPSAPASGAKSSGRHRRLPPGSSAAAALTATARCAREGCGRDARTSSRYCSDECGLSTAEARLCDALQLEIFDGEKQRREARQRKENAKHAKRAKKILLRAAEKCGEGRIQLAEERQRLLQLVDEQTKLSAQLHRAQKRASETVHNTLCDVVSVNEAARVADAWRYGDNKTVRAVVSDVCADMACGTRESEDGWVCVGLRVQMYGEGESVAKWCEVEVVDVGQVQGVAMAQVRRVENMLPCSGSGSDGGSEAETTMDLLWLPQEALVPLGTHVESASIDTTNVADTAGMPCPICYSLVAPHRAALHFEQCSRHGRRSTVGICGYRAVQSDKSSSSCMIERRHCTEHAGWDRIGSAQLHREVTRLTGARAELASQIDVIKQKAKLRWRAGLTQRRHRLLHGPDAVEHRERVDEARSDTMDAAAKADRIQRQMMPILNMLAKNRCHHFFAEPVDPVKLNLPTYLDIVKQPMDLGTVTSKLQRVDENSYGSLEECAHDIRLVFNNAMLFNAKDHLVHKVAQQMLYDFDNAYAELKECWDLWHTEHKEQLAALL